jgi:hypothetical protein
MGGGRRTPAHVCLGPCFSLCRWGAGWLCGCVPPVTPVPPVTKAHGGAASAVTEERGQFRVRARCSCSPSALRWGCESSVGSPVCCDKKTQWVDEESPEPHASQLREAMRQGTASQLSARARAHAVPAGDDAGAADAAAAPCNALADPAAHIVQHDPLPTHEAALRRLMADDGRLCKPHEWQGLPEPERLHREQSSGTPVQQCVAATNVATHHARRSSAGAAQERATPAATWATATPPRGTTPSWGRGVHPPPSCPDTCKAWCSGHRKGVLEPVRKAGVG